MNSPDSGQWSSSFASSPIKEQSPVHQSGSKGSVHQRLRGSKKSDLYGTPHWWPIEPSTDDQIEQDDMKEDMKSSKSSLEQNDELEAAVALQNSSSPSTPNDGQLHTQKPMAFVIDFNNDNDTADVKSDNGTYTLDEPRQSVDVCNGNGNDGGSISSSGVGDDQESWIYKWANDAAGRLDSLYQEEEGQYNNNETKEILSETEKIVESMQSRVNVQRSKSSISPDKVKKYPASMIKFNRAFNIRRTLNTNPPPNPTYDSDNCSSKSANPGDNSHFSRSDGGRFSLRMSRGDRRNFSSASDPEGHPIIPVRGQHGIPSRSSLASESSYRNSSPHPNTTSLNKYTPLKPPINSNTTNSSSSKQQKSIRSNSTMTSRDIELENWRRRKSYDPMRASGMGQRLTGSNSNVSANESKEPTGLNSSLDHRKNSSSSLLHTKKEFLKRSSSSVKPSNPPPSPTSASSSTVIPAKLSQPCCGVSRLENPAIYSCGEDHLRAFSDYKTQVQGHLEQRKFEALDTLVISTIHSLSTKVRNLSLNLLKKIQPTHGEDENGALIEEMITQLTELSQSQTCNNTTSKELSGTLRNIKKIEQVVLVLDRVLCDQDSSSESES